MLIILLEYDAIPYFYKLKNLIYKILYRILYRIFRNINKQHYYARTFSKRLIKSCPSLYPTDNLINAFIFSPG